MKNAKWEIINRLEDSRSCWSVSHRHRVMKNQVTRETEQDNTEQRQARFYTGLQVRKTTTKRFILSL